MVPSKRDPSAQWCIDNGAFDSHHQVTAVDEKDLKSKDEWVRRHSRLVRLTGRHPFNCEPLLPELMECGFVSTPQLHYVRNHGAVPVPTPDKETHQKVWDEWRITINGPLSSRRAHYPQPTTGSPFCRTTTSG